MAGTSLLEDTPESTDLTRWRLKSVGGEHWWTYLSQDDKQNSPQSFAEKSFLGLPVGNVALTPAATFLQSAQNGYQYFERMQLDDGHWACAYGGPSFLLPGIIFAMYITESPIPDEWRIEMIRYLAHTVNIDGGWGLHDAGDSTVFATVLYYVSLRILGCDIDHPLTRNARSCIRSFGGALGIPQWGKTWLACLNLYDWSGINPVPVEMWLLPDWIPFHPWRYWVQCRVVYLPISYLWTNRQSIPLDPLMKALRSEIYLEPYNTIIFSRNRDNVSRRDCKRRPSWLLWLFNQILWVWVLYLRPHRLVQNANRKVTELIKREDQNTDYNCIAPVNKALHMVCLRYLEGIDSVELNQHRQHLGSYLWMDKDGMTCSGTNGVQVWDTAFCIQAIAAGGLHQKVEFRASLENALGYLDISQITEDLEDPYRQIRKGGWPFSTKSNGYIVSDCSAESLKAVLILQSSGFPQLISDGRLQDCVDSLLEMQNPNGGFGTYEKTRASSLLEFFNPADVFERIMVEYSYPECTSAVVTALSTFRKHFPQYRRQEVHNSIRHGVEYIKRDRRRDGSWYGSWAICFTYATFFSLQALESVGETYQNSEFVQKSCKWLLGKQMEDGGWGEHFSSCEENMYINSSNSQVVNTAWAVLGLMYAGCPDRKAIERGLKLIQSRQQKSGEWLQEDIEGVFNRTCMIGYPNYKYYFPIWALGYYSNVYEPTINHEG
ncbi:terpene synthase [Microthyrium microscopicum]|uniref:Terpene cyclase/mutase family member n=1 Tax=Microthyrium microscopicum TaxID=703497 RepID=A0A6A6UJ49_9PEZI|nr:terpene synthase [Microthyrium microscopicum]